MSTNSQVTKGATPTSTMWGIFKRLTLTALLILPLAACDSPAEGLIPSKDKYDFTTSCEPESQLEACNSCCIGLSFDTALVALGDCGCSYQYSDWEICKASDGNFDACAACCEASDDLVASEMSQGECHCSGIQKTQPTEDRQLNKCEKSGDSCRCGRDGTGTCEAFIPGEPTLACGCSL